MTREEAEVKANAIYEKCSLHLEHDTPCPDDCPFLLFGAACTAPVPIGAYAREKWYAERAKK